jgi:hypothetical protein
MNSEEKQALIERCKKISEWRGKYGDFANVMLPAVEAQQIAEIALASLEAEIHSYTFDEDSRTLYTTPPVSEDWKQRAEAAEAKLAGLEKQQPVAWHHYQWRESPKGWDWYLIKSFSAEPKNGDGWKSIPLFTRPAPAVSLAELVPDTVGIHDMDPNSKDIEVVTAIAQCEGWNSCRATILRNIEEAK